VVGQGKKGQWKGLKEATQTYVSRENTNMFRSGRLKKQNTEKGPEARVGDKIGNRRGSGRCEKNLDVLKELGRK